MQSREEKTLFVARFQGSSACKKDEKTKDFSFSRAKSGSTGIDLSKFKAHVDVVVSFLVLHKGMLCFGHSFFIPFSLKTCTN